MLSQAGFQAVEVVCGACAHSMFYAAEGGVTSKQVMLLLESICPKCEHVGATVQLKYALPPDASVVHRLPAA